MYVEYSVTNTATVHSSYYSWQYASIKRCICLLLHE
jgi:hypothetical protein